MLGPFKYADPLLRIVEVSSMLGKKEWITLEQALTQRKTLVENNKTVYSTIREVKLIQEFVEHNPFHIWRAAVMYGLAWVDKRGKKILLRRFLSDIYREE